MVILVLCLRWYMYGAGGRGGRGASSGSSGPRMDGDCVCLLREKENEKMEK